MNPQDTPLLAADPRAAVERRSPGAALAVLALLLALVAVAGSGWLWWTDFRARSDIAARDAAETARANDLESRLGNRVQQVEAEVERLARSDSTGRVGALDNRVGALEERARAAEAGLAEQAAWSRTAEASVEGANARLAGLEARLATLEARGLDSSTELDLAELDYLLRLAQERLALFADVRTADRALGIADDHAAARDDPAFAHLRDEIATARRSLALVNLPDPTALDRELDAIQDRLQDLPFRGEALKSSAAEPAQEAGWWAQLKAALAGLATVRRMTGEADRLPPLADQELVRQRAWLEIERARLAAMRHDAAAYQSALQRARATFERWFEPDDRGTQATLQALASAAALDVDPALPDISAPSAALRALREAGASRP